MTNPFSFKGSIDMKKYIVTCIATYAVMILATLFVFVPLFNCFPVSKFLLFIFIAASQWIVIAASVRRLNDYGKARHELVKEEIEFEER